MTALVARPEASHATGPLVAYVGTFSAPLRDTLPTQVDLPPGNGRGIHVFDIDRTSGAMTPIDVLAQQAAQAGTTAAELLKPEPDPTGPKGMPPAKPQPKPQPLGGPSPMPGAEPAAA